MALVLKDRVKETTSTSGTGSITLLGAVQGFQGFSSIGEGNTTYYSIVGTTEWEVGIGTYSGGTLSRDTVLASSLNNTKVAFSVGVKDVFCTYAADRAVSTDSLGIATSVASPNATVNAVSLTAVAPSANADFVLNPKGTGALLADIPDSTDAGGDKRGAGAVDWQLKRATSDMVASGSYSMIVGGESNKASGNYSVSSGYLNTASGTSSGTLAGERNIAGGATSVVIGGSYGTTRNIVGYTVLPASNRPIFPKSNVSQCGWLIVAGLTSDATLTRLKSSAFSASAGNQLALADNSAVLVYGHVIANVTGGGNTKSWLFYATLKRGSGVASTVLIDSSIFVAAADSGTSGWDVSLTSDLTYGCLGVNVTGQASTTIRWVCKIEAVEVAY